MTIVVTIKDTETGTEVTREINNDYIIICAGTCYEDSIQTYKNGTHVVTIKGRWG